MATFDWGVNQLKVVKLKIAERIKNLNASNERLEIEVKEVKKEREGFHNTIAVVNRRQLLITGNLMNLL